MINEKVCIVIPVYKAHPTDSEVKSSEQCFKVLKKHPVSLVCGNSLDISFYESIASKFKRQFVGNRFNDGYFSSIQGYDKLLLSLEFYNRFKKFKYILLYQLDAWVFRDELDNWCSRGYDYIGAPWFEGWDKVGLNAKYIGVGNGGFSLRKVKSHLRFASFPFLWINRNKLFFNIYKGGYFDILKIIPRIIRRLYNNNLWVVRNRFDGHEDYFWSMIVGGNFKSFKIPSEKKASRFSFEMNPEKLFEVTEHELPFGCHAWEKNLNFWNQYILEKS